MRKVAGQPQQLVECNRPDSAPFVVWSEYRRLFSIRREQRRGTRTPWMVNDRHRLLAVFPAAVLKSFFLPCDASQNAPSRLSRPARFRAAWKQPPIFKAFAAGADRIERQRQLPHHGGQRAFAAVLISRLPPHDRRPGGCRPVAAPPGPHPKRRTSGSARRRRENGAGASPMPS